MNNYRTPHDHPDRRQIRHEQDPETGLYCVHVDGARTHESLTLGEATLAMLDQYRKYGADLKVSLPTAGPLVKRNHKLKWPAAHGAAPLDPYLSNCRIRSADEAE